MEKEIIEKASYLFLKYGYKSVTMDDLAEHMRISKKTIYECFDDKISLIRASVWYIFDEVKNLWGYHVFKILIVVILVLLVV